jgi:hypothetical protein
MKIKKILFIIILFLAGFPVTVTGEEVSVTVYNDDLALVRETRLIDLKKGVQKYQFQDVAAKIDPTSVYFKSLTFPDKVALLEQNFEFDLVGTERLLEKYINESIMVSTREGNTFSGKLLNSNGGDVIVGLKDGQVKVVKASAVENIEFPSLPEGLMTKPTLVWFLNCEKEGKHESEISYLTKGLKWHAEYVALVNADDSKVDLSGWVSINNSSGASYLEAKLKLVAGDVHTVEPERMPVRKMLAGTYMEAATPQFKEKAFFEYHLYTLQKSATLKDRQIKQISFFPSTEATVEKIYIFDSQQNGEKVRTLLEFKNDAASGLGMPLPKGKIRVYKKDEDKSQVFIGEDLIDHTPKNKKVRVFVGNAFDITGERTVKAVSKISNKSRKETVGILLKNHKKEDIKVMVVEHFGGDWEFIGPVPPIKKKSESKAELEISVPKNSERSFQYTVLYKQ